MLTDNKEITKPEYWEKVYTGKNDNAAVDSSNTVRPPNTFDRFGWVAGYAEGPFVLGVASGHAHIEKRIQASHRKWRVIASDQTNAAAIAAKYSGHYMIFNAYETPFSDKYFNTIICTQAMEYMEDQQRFLMEAERVADKLLITVPIGEMKLWSQLYIYEEESFCDWISQYGQIEVRDRQGDLLLIKLKFNEL